jgi:uncharacterized protein YegL
MPLPGSEKVAARPLHFIWIVDVSGSMSVDGKIQSLNQAIKDSIPAMRDVAEGNPFADVFVRAVRFSSGAQWHVATPTTVQDFQWKELPADGVTDMGAALSLVADALSVEQMGERGYPPVLVLVSDGQPTDDYKTGVAKIMATNWGRKAVRLSIAIGADADHGSLSAFVGDVERPVLKADNAESLTQYIKWVSTIVVNSVSSPTSKTTPSSEDSSKNPSYIDPDVWEPIPPAPTPVDASKIW